MKTLNDIQSMIQTEGAPAYRAYRDRLQAARDTLESIHAEHYTTNDTPTQTVEKYIAAVGYDLAAVVVASMVNRSAWDGRISDRAKTWAASIADALDQDGANRLELWSNKIHMVHLDQIARAFSRTERPTDPTDPSDDNDPASDTDTNEASGGASTWTPAPGDVVRVSGGYFARSNGLFFIAHPSGSSWWLEPITKAGKIKKSGAQFWPLASYCSDRRKNAAARQHNAEHAKMEKVEGVPTCYIAEYYRNKAQELTEAAEEQERRGCSYAADTRRSADEWQKYANRFSADDLPPETVAPSIRIYWNGIKVNGGDLVKCYYGFSDDELTIHARDYKDLPREFFEVVNNSDGMTDYFEQDHTSIAPDHPLFKFFHHAALKGIATGRSYRKMTEAQAAEWATMKDPGQPTEADAEAARAYRANQIEEAKKAREAKEAAEREADERRCEYQRIEGGRLIRETAAAHPIREGAPYVVVRWSEHPAFYDWEDDALTLSIAAADLIFKRLDDEQHSAKKNGGDQFGPCAWCYYKTKFQIHYTDPETGEPQIFEDRYDLGDGLGGLIAFYVGANPEGHPFSEMLLDNQAGGRVVSVTVAPWVEKAMQRKAQQAARETAEIFTMASMLTDEQIEEAVNRLDRSDPGAEDVARFFIQELYRRNEEKALETWQRWQTGA